jgi:hypothetical protein
MDAQAEWTIFDERWWLLPLALRVVLVSTVLGFSALSGFQVDGIAVVLALLVVLTTAHSWWVRVRLTAEGIEVRRLRTRMYRWSDVQAVTITDGWHSGIVVHDGCGRSRSRAAVLPFPRGTFRTSGDRTLEEAVAEITSRLHAAPAPRRINAS